MAPRSRLKWRPKNPSNSRKPPSIQHRNWLELPHDVTCTILLKLGAIEILETAQKVCTLWRSICKDPLMWRSIDMRNLGDLHAMPYDLEKMAMHAVDRSCGQLIDINVEYFGNDEFLKYIADRSSHLRRLRFVCCYGSITNEGLAREARKLPLLEELELSYCDISREGLEAVGCSCPLLKSLKFNNQASQHLLNSSDEDVLAIAEHMPNLRHLQLFGNDLTNIGLKAILDGCPHLDSLDLRQCFNINLGENVVKICAERIKDLRRPNDSTDSYEFDARIYDGNYPSDFSDFDPLYGYDSYDDFTRWDFNDEEDDFDLYGFSDMSLHEYAQFFD